MVVDVLVEQNTCLDQTFTYEVPKQLLNEIVVGKRVLVPFGKKELAGFILNIPEKQEYDFELKSIIKVIDQEAVLNQELLKLGEYIKTKTLSPLIYCYQTMLPSGKKASFKNSIPQVKEKYLQLQVEKLNNYKPTEKGQKVLSLFKDNKVLKKTAMTVSSSAVNTLMKHDIIIEILKEKNFNFSEKKLEKHLKLTKEQQKCFDEIIANQNNFHPFLLHGVTGSGKTEIYLQAIANVIKQNKQAIVLVPEISLTSQIVAIFKKRFGNQIAVLHSRLTNNEKYFEYEKIRKNQVKIVVGARSAIFAPFDNIGIIIVDEEHSLTYKQENSPKYYAIDVAIWRAKFHKCPLILASATPTIESYTRSKMGIYTLLEIKKTINKAQKHVQIIDMKDEMRMGQRYLAKELIKAIKKTLASNEQVILFLNRRGFNTTIVCGDCGEVLKCPDCDVSLTYHKEKNLLKCHYCFYQKNLEKECDCKGKWRHFGIGTQKLVAEIEKEFRDAKIVRMDLDSTLSRNSHQKIIKDFADLKYDILVGTQMISKGLDFPNVTLVGIINGDAGLSIPDFRSGERTFQLINQVAGRAGRTNKESQVILQCFNPNHYSIKYALTNNYDAFYKAEMNLRKKMNYPPFVNLTLLKLKSSNYDYLLKEAEKIAKIFQKNERLTVVGPTINSVSKISKMFIVNILIKYQNRADIIYELTNLQELCFSKKLKIEIDINPWRI